MKAGRQIYEVLVAAMTIVVLPVALWTKFQTDISSVAGGDKMWKMICLMVPMAGASAAGLYASRIAVRLVPLRRRSQHRGQP
jgi:hypothetical protein